MEDYFMDQSEDNTQIGVELSQKFTSQYNTTMTKEQKVEEIVMSMHDLDTIAELLYSQVANRINTQMLIEKDKFTSFIHLLVAARISFVRFQAGCSSDKIKQINPKSVKYPSILFPILSALGIVQDTQTATTFVPALANSEWEELKNLGQDVVIDAMSMLLNAERFGLELTQCMPKQELGSFAYTMMLTAEKVLKHHRNDVSPSDVCLAAILVREERIKSAFTQPFSYGTLDSFGMIEFDLVASGFKQRG